MLAIRGGYETSPLKVLDGPVVHEAYVVQDLLTEIGVEVWSDYHALRVRPRISIGSHGEKGGYEPCLKPIRWS